jgi:predicted kinase
MTRSTGELPEKSEDPLSENLSSASENVSSLLVGPLSLYQALEQPPVGSSRLVLLVAAQASGKSSLAKYFEEGGDLRLSADDIRIELYGSALIYGDSAVVFGTLFARVREAMKARRNIVIDNTNINVSERKLYLDMAAEEGIVDIHTIWLDVPKETCLLLNSSRSRVVPLDQIDSMFDRLEAPQDGEGKVTVLRPLVDLNEQCIEHRQYAVIRSELAALQVK